MGFPWPTIIESATDLIGGFFGRDQDRKIAHENQDLQKQFAQQGIRWKVADAKAAGINPLAALGASTTSYQPSRAFGQNRVGKALSKMGQNVSRAMVANAGKRDRQIQSQILIEQLRTAKLTNDGLEIRNSQASNPQGVPSTGDALTDAMNKQGQGNAGNNSVSGNAAIMVKPDEYVPMKQMGVSAATNPLKKHYVDNHGWVWNLYNQEAAESIESDNLTQIRMSAHEGLRWFSGAERQKKPKVPVPKGYRLVFSKGMNQWRVVKGYPKDYKLPSIMRQFAPKKYRQRFN